MTGDLPTVLYSGRTTFTDYLPSTTVGNITVGTTTSMNWCQPCGTYWYPWYGHYCSHQTAHEHDYQQADGAFNDTLYCRKCGETKRLKTRQTREAK